MARPEPWLVAAGLVGMLLVEVWQSSTMAELRLSLEHTRTAYTQASARLDFVRAGLERRTTRAELTPLASELGLAPADAQQVVALPSEYLAVGETDARDGSNVSTLAWAERISRALVPEAKARVNAGN
jgi:hypothetical protein